MRKLFRFGVFITLIFGGKVEIVRRVGNYLDVVIEWFRVAFLECVLDVEAVFGIRLEFHFTVRRKYLLAVMLDVKRFEVLVESVSVFIDYGYCSRY